LKHKPTETRVTKMVESKINIEKFIIDTVRIHAIEGEFP